MPCRIRLRSGSTPRSVLASSRSFCSPSNVKSAVVSGARELDGAKKAVLAKLREHYTVSAG